MTINKLALCSIGLLSLSAPASAQMSGFGEGEGFTIGLSVIADWSPYDGADSPSTTPIPYVAYDWDNAHLGIDGFSYDFWNTDALTVTALLEPRWSFGDPEDSPLFKDIERDTALEAGVEAQLSLGALYLSGSVLRDISDVHNGFEADAAAGIEMGLGAALLDVSAGYAYRNKRLSLHLYGVRSDEARDGLAAFAPKASGSPYIRTQMLYPIGDKMGVLAFARYEHLGKEATDSPLINQDYDATVGAAVLRRF